MSSGPALLGDLTGVLAHDDESAAAGHFDGLACGLEGEGLTEGRTRHG